MEQPHYLNDVLIFLLASVVVVSIFRRLKTSPIIGYLIAGVFIGPFALAFIVDVEGTKILGKLGVVFLLFTIGLKLPLQHLQVLKNYVFGLGLAQVLVTGTIIGLIAYSFGQTIEASIIIGSALALSSTAVVLQILTEKEELAARFGRASFAILLLQDLVVIVLLVLLSTLGQENLSLLNELGFAALKAGLVLAIIIAMGRIILRPVYRAIATLGNPELFVAMTLLVVLTTSVTTAAAGLSMELGAFLAGLLLAETEYRHQVEADIQPYYGLLLGLFFITVGMSIDLRLLANYAGVITILTVAMIVGKTVIITGLCRLFAIPNIASFRVGLLLASGGEFAFVIFALAIEGKLVPHELVQILFVVVSISMGFTPLLDKVGKYIDDFYTEKEAKATIKAASREIGDLSNHVIIAGFGRVGQLLAKMLSERLIPYVAIDNNMNNVSKSRSRGLPVFYGDARRLPVMRAIGAEHAKVVIISINRPVASVQAAMMVRRNFPKVDVFVRMRDDTHEAKLSDVGIKVIMPENLEPSLQLAASVLESIGTAEAEANQVIEGFRRTFTAKQTTTPLPDETSGEA